MDIDRRLFLRSAVLAAASLGGNKVAPAQATDAKPGEGTIQLDAHPLAAVGDGSKLAWAYGNAAPGPILRIKKGMPVRIRLDNRIGEPTSIDWHGMRLPNHFEILPGLTGSSIASGNGADITLLAPDSGTYWFHPGILSQENQTARGLAGALVVEEAEPPAADQDKILFLTDRPGEPVPATPGSSTVEGRLLINGRGWPEAETLAPGSRLRLRIINGSTREAVAATFVGAPAMVIAIDGQPSELFKPLNDSLPVGPGARFDILVDLPRLPGAEFKLLLRGSMTTAASPSPAALYVAKTEGVAVPERPPMRSLAPNPALPSVIPLEHSARAELTVRSVPAAHPPGPTAWSINAISGIALPKKPLLSVKRNSPVTLTLRNGSTQLIAFRLHGHAMRLLHAMDDGWEPYWRDSVIVPPGVIHHVAFMADNPGKWLIESPFFDQAVGGLRTWFEVV